MIKRLHLFEFEDQSWFPDQLRSLVTDLLQFEQTSWKIYTPIIPKIKEVMQKINCHRMIDLCSGGGGQLLPIQEILKTKENYPISVTLTDKYPNLEAFERICQFSNDRINFIPDSVDATDVKIELEGFRTLFTSFHHFRPETAKQILQDAADKKAAIGIFEFTERTIFNLIQSILLVPLITIFLTPFVRPFKWSRLFWTYIIPLSPFIVSWDAFVSYLRTYSPEELEQMTSEIKSTNYTWNIGKVKWKMKIVGDLICLRSNIIYLIGYPENSSES